MREEIALLFAPQQSRPGWSTVPMDFRSATRFHKGHGRLETHLLWASTELNDFLARDWYGVGHVFCLRRRVEHALRCTQAIVYGLTSLTPKQADPSRLLRLHRERLHHRKSLAFSSRWRACRRCAARVRKGSAPHVLAVLNAFVLALFDWCQVSNVKQQMRCLHAHPLQAARLLLKSLKEN